MQSKQHPITVENISKWYGDFQTVKYNLDSESENASSAFELEYAIVYVFTILFFIGHVCHNYFDAKYDN